MAISANNDRLTIILNKELKAKIKNLADSENRSASNYIVTILEEHVADVESKEGLFSPTFGLDNPGIERDSVRKLGGEGISRDSNRDIGYSNVNEPSMDYFRNELDKRLNQDKVITNEDIRHLNSTQLDAFLYHIYHNDLYHLPNEQKSSPLLTPVVENTLKDVLTLLIEQDKLQKQKGTGAPEFEDNVSKMERNIIVKLIKETIDQKLAEMDKVKPNAYEIDLSEPIISQPSKEEIEAKKKRIYKKFQEIDLD